MKKVILISSLAIIAVLFAEAYRENLSMDWQHYQRLYKGHLKMKAQTESERDVAEQFQIQMRQIVLPELNRVDRCVICHVGMEDERMKDMPNPLKTHPGNYLETHEVEKVGCTICHDGQGRAITFQNALAHGHGKFWEKPALLKPYVEANCYRCHSGTLEETPNYNSGKALFETKGCLGCHQIDGKGGTQGPALSNLGNESFHVKMPTAENREELLHTFSDNVNLAYIYEAVKDPHAQPKNSAMVDYKFTKEEAKVLTVYLKSLMTDPIPKELVAKDAEGEPLSSLERGAISYRKYCVACHGPNGEGTHLKELDKIGPAIGNTEFLSIASPKLLKHVISYSRGGEMPAFKTTGGLDDQEINDIVEYIRSFKSTPPSFEDVMNVEGNPQFGEHLFRANCSSCHGSGGNFEQDLIGPTLNNPTLLGLATKEFWYNTIVKGRPGTAMPSWHFFNKEQLADLIAYLESLKPAKLDKEKVLNLVATTASVKQGEKVFKGKCISCHSLTNEGVLAPNLQNEEFQQITDERLLFDMITTGRAQTAMPSWNHLSEIQMADLIAYIKSWQKGPSIYLSNKRIIGSEREGETIFKESCLNCHSVTSGSMVAPAILSKGFLSQTSDEYIKHTVMYGRGLTEMRPYLRGRGGIVELTEEEINSVVAYMRSFEDNPVDMTGRAIIYGNTSKGKELFQSSCAQCHGDYAEGGIGPAIGKKGFLDTVSDGFIYSMIRIGRTGTEMKAFPPHGDGFSNLTEEEISDIIGFLRSNVNEAEKHSKKVRGYAQRGGEYYKTYCAQCHGPEGTGGLAPSLVDENFMNVVTDSYLQATMALGRHGTQMRPMMKGGGGVVELNSQDVNDIISYLRSLMNKD